MNVSLITFTDLCSVFILLQDFSEKISTDTYSPDVLKYIIVTKVGEGPTCESDNTNHLLNDDGLPKTVTQ